MKLLITVNGKGEIFETSHEPIDKFVCTLLGQEFNFVKDGDKWKCLDKPNASCSVEVLKEKLNPLRMEFNNPEFSVNRAAVEGMTLQEENEAIDFLNQVIITADRQALLGKVSLDKLQKLIWNYENACHFRSSHGG